MTRNTTPQSGTSKLPKLLAAPRLLPLNDATEIKGILCYVIKHYGQNGLSALVCRRRQSLAHGGVDYTVHVVTGDWSGQVFDLGQNGRDTAMAIQFMERHAGLISQTMKLINIAQAQFYFGYDGDDLVLVDIQTALDKLCGPGLVRDVFGKIIRTQEVKKIEVMDDRTLAAITTGDGIYCGGIILKPSKFRTVQRQDGNRPLYVEVRR